MPADVGYRRVNYGGKVQVFPGDATDEEIAAALDQAERRKAITRPVENAAATRSRMAGTGSVFTDAALAGMSGEGGSYADPNATGGDIARRAMLQASVLSAGAGGAAIRGAGAIGRGALPFIRPAAGIAKDLVVAQGLEELAKASGIPGAPVIAEVFLGRKAYKTGAKALLEKSFERWAAKKAAAAAAKTAAPVVARAATTATAEAAAAPVAEAGVRAAPYTFALTNSRGVKMGEKIWMELDKAGNPLRILTPDLAGAASRAGKVTTWVKKTWS